MRERISVKLRRIKEVILAVIAPMSKIIYIDKAVENNELADKEASYFHEMYLLEKRKSDFLVDTLDGIEDFAIEAVKSRTHGVDNQMDINSLGLLKASNKLKQRTIVGRNNEYKECILLMRDVEREDPEFWNNDIFIQNYRSAISVAESFDPYCDN